MEEKLPTIPAQNVAFAVNYSLPSVDQFIQTARTPAERVESTGESTKRVDAKDSLTPTREGEGRAPPQRAQLAEKDMNRTKRVTIVDETPATPAKRSSNRERKPRPKSHEKVRVRYDMNHVPHVQRHEPFVAHHRRTQIVSHHPTKRRALPPRRSARTAKDHVEDDAIDTCHKCKGEELPAPFVADSSVVWIPTKRTEWEDCLSEMTAVCTSAALRRHVASQTTSNSKPFFAPLSQAYIRDRIDIDDPLEGYQIRHKTGGWLQGFILWTNFTTWTHYFKWDSLDERSGVLSSQKVDKTRHVDQDGSLSAELEAQPRSGDPLATGVVSPTIAEIGLLGGIGCGEYLLRMAIDDIRSRGQYKYIVMQATDASRTFYERFGFVRVGAVCRYGTNGGPAGSSIAVGQPKAEGSAAPTETDIVGYRHWTYANERNLETYGGPSYMMALRLPTDDALEVSAECPKCASEVQAPSVIEQLKALAVNEKPKITQLGAAPTPFKRASLPPVPKPVFVDARPSPYPPGVKRRGRPPKWPQNLKPTPSGGATQPPLPLPVNLKKHVSEKKATVNRKRGRPCKHPPPARRNRMPGVYPPGAKRRGRPPKHWPPGVKRQPVRQPTPTPSVQPEQPVKRGPGRPRKHPLPEPVTAKTSASIPANVSTEQSNKKGRGRPRKHPLPEPVTPKSPAKKQRRTLTAAANLEEQREVLMTPPSKGESLSYSQKQYQSVWLAVPPTTSRSGGRRPPRQREAFLGDPGYFRKRRKSKAQETATDAPPSDGPTDDASSTVLNPQDAGVSPYPPGVKRRGRPPKKTRGVPNKSSDVNSQESSGRGCPPKNAPQVVDPKEQKESPYPPGVKRRGRPPKKAKDTSTVKPQEIKKEPVVKRRSSRLASVP